MLSVQWAQNTMGPAVECMRLDLGGGHILMTQQFLHRADISAGFHKVRREAVPQRMRTDWFDDVGSLGCRMDGPL